MIALRMLSGDPHVLKEKTVFEFAQRVITNIHLLAHVLGGTG